MWIYDYAIYYNITMGGGGSLGTQNLYYVIYRRPINRMDQSLLRKPIYSKLLALYDNYDVSKVIILFSPNTRE